MNRWSFGIFETLREEATDGVPDNKGGGGSGEAPKTFNVNGKDVPVETLSAALSLHNAMSDPEIGKEIIEQLARKTGLIKDGELTAPKGEVEKKLEGKFQKHMKAKLGKDYEKFADTLGPVLDEAIEEFMDEFKRGSAESSAAVTWGDAVDRFTATHELTVDVEAKMQELISRGGGRPNLKGKEAVEYLSDMYELAVKKLGKVVNRDDRDERDDDEIEEPDNRGRRPKRPNFREVERPKGPLTVDQIVEAASRGIRYRG